jgi:hypothetical protein
MRSTKLVATLVGVVLALAVAPTAYAMPVDPVGALAAAGLSLVAVAALSTRRRTAIG